MTQEQHIMTNAWARGADWLPVRKVGKRHWIIVNDGIWAPLGRVPIVFKTKREAIDFCNNLCLIRFREWREEEENHA